MRGDYVILSYPMSSLTAEDIATLGPNMYSEMPVYRPLTRGEDGVAVAGPLALTPPPWPFIGGKLEGGRVSYGIEVRGGCPLPPPPLWALPPQQPEVCRLLPLVCDGVTDAPAQAFYVEEGTGLTWEARRNQGQLCARVGILKDGRAGLVDLLEDCPRTHDTLKQRLR
jgi:hypothetical protein